jgi:hypothetical protein
MMRRSPQGLIAALLLPAAPCAAQEWAKKMSPVVKHAFGTIVWGAKAEYELIFTDPCVGDIHVASARKLWMMPASVPASGVSTSVLAYPSI